IVTATRGPLACPSNDPVTSARAPCTASPTTAAARATSPGDFVVPIFISSLSPARSPRGELHPRDHRLWTQQAPYLFNCRPTARPTWQNAVGRHGKRTSVYAAVA